jgi:hypothetical protein
VDNGSNLRVALLEEQVATLASILQKLLPLVGALNAHLMVTVEQSDAEAFRTRANELRGQIDNLIEKFEEHWSEAP